MFQVLFHHQLFHHYFVFLHLREYYLNNYSENNLLYFQKFREKRIKKLQKSSLRNLKIFHIKNPILKFIIHSGLYILNKIIPLIIIQSSWIYKFNAFKVGIK